MINGKVTNKFEQDGEGFVEVTHEARNQDDELSVLGTATAKLPRKAV